MKYKKKNIMLWFFIEGHWLVIKYQFSDSFKEDTGKEYFCLISLIFVI